MTYLSLRKCDAAKLLVTTRYTRHLGSRQQHPRSRRHACPCPPAEYWRRPRAEPQRPACGRNIGAVDSGSHLPERGRRHHLGASIRQARHRHRPLVYLCGLRPRYESRLHCFQPSGQHELPRPPLRGVRPAVLHLPPECRPERDRP